MLILLHNFTQYVLLYPFTFKYISLALTLSSAFFFIFISQANPCFVSLFFLCSFSFLISFFFLSTSLLLNFFLLYRSICFLLIQLYVNVSPCLFSISFSPSPMSCDRRIYEMLKIKTFPMKKGFPLPLSNFTAWDPITYLPIHA